MRFFILLLSAFAALPAFALDGELQNVPTLQKNFFHRFNGQNFAEVSAAAEAKCKAWLQTTENDISGNLGKTILAKSCVQTIDSGTILTYVGTIKFL